MATVFDEILFNNVLITAESATASPEYANTTIKNPTTGVFKVNITRYDPQLIITLDLRQITTDELEYFTNFWHGGWGSAYGFRLHWAGDFYAIDEAMGTGDGGTVVFPIYKNYARPGSSTSYSRRIIKPVTNTNVTGGVTLYEYDGTTARTIPSLLGTALGIPAFTVKVGGVATSAYAINNTTGIITLTKKTFTADSATDIITSTSHGFTSNQAIKVENSGGALPAPLVTNTLYYVRDVTTHTFKLSASAGPGSAINLTTNGTGTQSISGPPVGSIISWSGEFDTPVRFLANNYQGKVDVASEISGIQLVEILPAELEIT